MTRQITVYTDTGRADTYHVPAGARGDIAHYPAEGFLDVRVILEDGALAARAVYAAGTWRRVLDEAVDNPDVDEDSDGWPPAPSNVCCERDYPHAHEVPTPVERCTSVLVRDRVDVNRCTAEPEHGGLHIDGVATWDDHPVPPFWARVEGDVLDRRWWYDSSTGRKMVTTMMPVDEVVGEGSDA